MNPETEKNVNEAIDWLQKTGGQIQDFAVEQAPLYCREVVAWDAAMGYTLIASGVLCLMLATPLWLKAQKLLEKRKDSYDEDGLGHWIFAIAFAIASILLFVNGACLAVKATVAPRLVIVEHLRSLK